MATTGPGDVFQLIRDGRVRTRTEVADETGLSRTTVVVKVAALLKLGLIVPASDVRSIILLARPPALFFLSLLIIQLCL